MLGVSVVDMNTVNIFQNTNLVHNSFNIQQYIYILLNIKRIVH